MLSVCGGERGGEEERKRGGGGGRGRRGKRCKGRGEGIRKQGREVVKDFEK